MDSKHEELFQAKTMEEWILYLELFEKMEIPAGFGPFKSCAPISMGHQIIKTLELCPNIHDASDDFTEDVGLVHGSFVLPGEKGAAILLACARELWGQEKTKALDLFWRREKARTLDIIYPPKANSRLMTIATMPILPDGHISGIESAIMIYANKRWCHTDRRICSDSYLNRTFSMYGRLAVVTQVLRKRSWSLEIGFPNVKASLSILTDPTGVKESFKLRDVPEGKARRDALLHWITEHWRQSRHDPDVETYVRGSLRGKTGFHWFDMDCQIHIPESDTERLGRAKKHRQVMNILGLDRRIRQSHLLPPLKSCNP